MNFEQLGLHPALVSAVKASGYTEPTPVQAAAIPVAITGRDLLVSSSTGSGKTAAFMLPALHHIANNPRNLAPPPESSKSRNNRFSGPGLGPRLLVLTPTRELALQVSNACSIYGKGLKGLRVGTILGGVPYGKQLQMLRGTLDILIATPGRLLDHLRSGKLDLSTVEILVLDEADRMLDMGFIDDIQAIVDQTPDDRQTLMFSATFAGAVAKLANNLTRNPQNIALTSNKEQHANIEQRLHWADGPSHKQALLDHLLSDPEIDQAIIFTSTQSDTEYLAKILEADGHAVGALHGGMPQGKRNRALQNLRQGHFRMLVATDVAARGIDIPTISHVINFGLPMTEEDYVHRIGRTGRAGRSGLAVTLAEPRSASMIRRIERFITQPIPVSTIDGLEPQMRAAPSGARRHVPGSKPKFGNRDSLRNRSAPSGYRDNTQRKHSGSSDKRREYRG